MRVLWICCFVFPEVARKLGLSEALSGGWLIGMRDSIINKPGIELFICSIISGLNIQEQISINNIEYILLRNDSSTIPQEFKKISDAFRPDVVHIHGTEYDASLLALKAFGPKRCVISIQGLIGTITTHYFTALPPRIAVRRTLFDRITHSGLEIERDRFEKREKVENCSLKLAKNIIGRTEWDKAYTSLINPDIRYFHCYETLRDAFYSGKKWCYDACEPQSIFISNSAYPIKGFHVLLAAVALIKEEFKNIKIYVAGVDLSKYANGINRFRQQGYVRYINDFINNNKLRNNVIYIGPQNQYGIRDALLKSNVFICPSLVENGSNALGEAMILGVPTIASYAGGIPSMLWPPDEGYLYQSDAPYMLAHYIADIFTKRDGVSKMSVNEIARASAIYDRENNASVLWEIYQVICGSV